MLYIIIPVFNRKKFTKDCLDSLKGQTYQDFQVIVVDDGSTDGTSEMLQKEYPEVIVLRGDGNLWWTASINLGIEYALQRDAAAVMTLNNDTVASEDFLEKMVEGSKIYSQALIGAFAMDYHSKKPVYGGGTIDWLTASFHSLLQEGVERTYHGLHEVDHFPGRGLLIPVEVFKQIGLFNQKIFPHYVADYDFTHQAVKNGFKIYCNYDAILYTFPDESGDRSNRQKKTLNKYYSHLFGIKGGGNIRNFVNFAWRNCPPVYLPVFLSVGLFKRVFGYLIK